MKKRDNNLTLSDISKITGYSITTISRVINNEKYVKDETRKKINAVIEELEFKPFWLARGLRTGKTDLVAVIFKDIANSFTSQVITSVQETLYKMEKDIILFNANFDRNLEVELLNIALEKKVDGIILSSMGLTASEISLIKKNIIQAQYSNSAY